MPTKEIYDIPYGESIAVMADGYQVRAMDNCFNYHTVAWFYNEWDAEEFAEWLCLKYGNRPDNCMEYAKWAERVKAKQKEEKKNDNRRD